MESRIYKIGNKIINLDEVTIKSAPDSTMTDAEKTSIDKVFNTPEARKAADDFTKKRGRLRKNSYKLRGSVNRS
ncbi:MAG: hypothetical protein QM632_05575 [Micrococcaceae bacterium]